MMRRFWKLTAIDFGAAVLVCGFDDGHADVYRWVDQSTFDTSQNQVFFQRLYPGESGEGIRFMVRGYAFERLL